MYSGTTLTRFSGRIAGAHQKIDRSARNNLSKILDDDSLFPRSRRILHFEGKNGPDAIKRKSPARDEPWHYYSPFDDDDSELIEQIRDHYKNLVKELKRNDEERAAFEAAWLAHAIVDGLTPAHHYPYEQKLSELRGGRTITDRVTIFKKIVMPGSSAKERISNNWKMWGPRGLFTSHGLFELGIAVVIAPLSFGESVPKNSDIKSIQSIGPVEWFQRAAKEIAVLDMYENYQKKGWTPKLAWQVRHRLAPLLVHSVSIIWYQALIDAGKLYK